MKFAIYEMYDNGIQFTRESNFITEIIYSPFIISIEGIQVLLISLHLFQIHTCLILK